VLRLLGLDGERGKDVCTRWEPLYGRPCFYAPPSTPCPCTCACVERASDDTSALCDGASPGAATSTANTSIFASTAASHPGGAVVTGVASRAGNKSSQASPVGKSTRPKIRPKRVRPGRLEAHSKGTGRRLLDFYTTRELIETVSKWVRPDLLRFGYPEWDHASGVSGHGSPSRGLSWLLASTPEAHASTTDRPWHGP